MNQIAIKDITTALSDNEIESSIQSLLQRIEVDEPEDKFFLIADIVGQIAELTLLKKVVHQLRSLNLMSQKKVGYLDIDEYSDTEKAKILASIYSLQLAYFHFWILNNYLNDKINQEYFQKFGLQLELPQLSIRIEYGVIHFNLFEVVEFIQKKVTLSDRTYADTQSPEIRSQFIAKVISELNNLWFIRGHDLYKTQIDYWKTTINSAAVATNSTPIPHTEKDNYPFSNHGHLLFEHLMKYEVRTGRGRQADIAYFYWRMYNDRFVRQRPEDFKKWFQDEYNNGEYLGKFRTLSELKDSDRDRKYIDAVEWLKTRLKA